MMFKKLGFPFLYFYLGASYRVRVHINFIVFFKKRKMYRLAQFFSRRLQKIQGVYISYKACFDNSIELRHPVGIVIGEGVHLGKGVIIYQNVTIGGARIGDGKENNYPEIGDETVIFSGAAIIGKIKVGSNCIIGANSVVTKSVPDNSVAVGSPARILSKK